MSRLSEPQQRILRAVAAGQVRRDELALGRPSHAAGEPRRCTATTDALHRLGLIEPGADRDGRMSTWQLTDDGRALASRMGREVSP